MGPGGNGKVCNIPIDRLTKTVINSMNIIIANEEKKVNQSHFLRKPMKESEHSPDESSSYLQKCVTWGVRCVYIVGYCIRNKKEFGHQKSQIRILISILHVTPFSKLISFPG